MSKAKRLMAILCTMAMLFGVVSWTAPVYAEEDEILLEAAAREAEEKAAEEAAAKEETEEVDAEETLAEEASAEEVTAEEKIAEDAAEKETAEGATEEKEAVAEDAAEKEATEAVESELKEDTSEDEKPEENADESVEPDPDDESGAKDEDTEPEKESAQETDPEEEKDPATDEENGETSDENTDVTEPADEGHEETSEEEPVESEEEIIPESDEEEPVDEAIEEVEVEVEELEEEPEEEIDFDQLMLDEGYIQVTVIREAGTNTYDAPEEDANATGHLDYEDVIWAKPLEGIWAELYSEDGEEEPSYFNLNNVLLLQGEVNYDVPIRQVKLSSSLEGVTEVEVGTMVTMKAEFTGFMEDEIVEITWQYRNLADEADSFHNINDAHGYTYSYPIDYDNVNNEWRVVMTLKS